MSNTAKFTFQRIKHFIGFPASGYPFSTAVGGAAVHDLGFIYVLNPIATIAQSPLPPVSFSTIRSPGHRYLASLMRYRGVAVTKGRRWPLPRNSVTPICLKSGWVIITATTARASSGRCARSSTSDVPTIRNSTS